MGIYTCSLEATLADQEINNVLCIYKAAPGGENEEDALEIATRVGLLWKTHIVPQLAVLYTLTGCSVRGVTTPGVIGFAALSGTGGIGSQSLPSFAVAKVQLFSATPGRAGTGRTGLSGIPEPNNAADAVSVNSLTPTYAAALNAAFEQFRTGIRGITVGGDTDVHLAVLSRYEDKVERPNPLASIVTSSKVAQKMGSRVSRLR